MDHVQRGIDFIFSSYKRTAAFLVILGIALTIPVTLSFLSQTQQTRSSAAPSARLYFNTPSVIQANTCQSISMDVMVDPGNNLVSIVDFTINFDPTKLIFESIEQSEQFPTLIKTGGLENEVNMSVSVGSDVTRAVQTPTKVATVKFKPQAAGSSQLQFDTEKTRVFSVSPNDQPTENVLSSANPAQVEISSGTCNQELTPTLTSTPQVISPTPTETPLSPTQIPTSIPTVTELPSSLSFIIEMPGISSSSALGRNPNPQRPQRKLVFDVYDADNARVFIGNIPNLLAFDQATGLFGGQINTGNFPATQSAQYFVKVKFDNSLFRQSTGIITIQKGTNTTVPITRLISGDLNQDNEISLLDYNIMLTCLLNSSCEEKFVADLNDDGKVSEVDLNILYAGFARRIGD